jgi:hypothetical protein
VGYTALAITGAISARYSWGTGPSRLAGTFQPVGLQTRTRPRPSGPPPLAQRRGALVATELFTAMGPGCRAKNSKVTTATRTTHHVLITKPNERERHLLAQPDPAIWAQIDTRAAFRTVRLQPHASIELSVALCSQVGELRLKVCDLFRRVAKPSL